MIISPFTMNQNHVQLMMVYCSLQKVNKILRRNIEEDGELDGIDSILDCLAENVLNMAEQFEFLKLWAEDANVQICHERYFGKETRLEVQKYDRSRRGVAASGENG